MKQFRFLDLLLGWLCFLIALVTYILTMEPGVSYWDSGEFIASIHRLQVPHQPGAPLFLMIYKVFSLLAGNEPGAVAWFSNLGTAVCSAFTILFLFWTISALAKRLLAPHDAALSPATSVAILGAALTGALAYTFSDTFWFSAVETEVYALSSLFTAITFWAILKWDAAASKPGAGRWLLLIAYMTGLSIGVHLLNLLAIPSIVLLWYFRRYPYSLKGLGYALLGGIALLLFIQYGVIPGSIALASRLELLLVNGLDLPFHSGLIAFILMLTALLTLGLHYSIRRGKVALNTALLCFCYLYIGFSSYALIVLRAQAGTNINISRPEHTFALLHYLSRGQYLQQPLLNGPDFTSAVVEVEESRSPELSRYRKTADGYEPGAFKQEIKYDREVFFPRMWYTEYADFYRSWLGLSENERPGFGDQLRFLFSYQAGHLYWRYFMWNFAGRANDIQGNYAGTIDGNWISGIPALDAARLGNMKELPARVTENKAHNRLFCLPLLLGLAGLAYQYRKNRNDFVALLSLFIFTGLAIVVYLNQYPLQPRERDYAFAGSFYVFAIWIGLGVLALHEWLALRLRRVRPAYLSYFSGAVCLLAVPFWMAIQEWDDHDRSGRNFARDMAHNYLAGLAPNSILVTNADNNTYPLWYLQEVEGLRSDVRVAIYQFFGAESYVEQMKDSMNLSPPLPLSLGAYSYAENAPNWIPVVDRGLKEAVPLREMLAFTGTDQPAYKVTLSNGQASNYFPGTRFMMEVDPESALASGALEPGETPAEKLEWEYPENYVSKPQLVMLDLLAGQRWTRPFYLASTSAAGLTPGLDDFYRHEGMAMRLTPVKNASGKGQDGDDYRTGTSQLYENLMHTYRFEGLRDPHLYVDSETVTMINQYREMFARLALATYEAGETERTVEVIDRMREVLPARFERSNAPIHNIQVLPHIQMAELYYQCGQAEKGDSMMEEAGWFLTDSLDYYASLKNSRRTPYGQDISIGLYALQQMQSITEAYRRDELHRKFGPAYRTYRQEFRL